VIHFEVGEQIDWPDFGVRKMRFIRRVLAPELRQECQDRQVKAALFHLGDPGDLGGLGANTLPVYGTLTLNPCDSVIHRTIFLPR
jgi:hypothetical protein